jgi:DNA-binding transcriptional LysR family regulator
VIHVTPNFTGPPGADAWAHVLAMLDSREADLAVLSTLGLTEEEARFPARFDALRLGEDSLVAVARADHPIIREPTLDAYCAARHMVVSLRGDPSGAVDASLAAIGQARRVVLTVPNFMSALFIAAGSDLVGALPRSLVSAFGRHLGLGFVPLPFPSTASVMRLVVTKAALADAGIAWLAGLIRDLNAPHP